MARLIKENEYWACDRYPWGCSTKHKTKDEAKKCEKANAKPKVYRLSRDNKTTSHI